MQKPWMNAVCFTCLALLLASSAGAARLAFVLGTIDAPQGVNEGDDLAPGVVVRTGDDALVMVEHRWASDIKSRDCIQIAIFGYGQSYTVSESATPGRCETTVPSNLAALDGGQPFLMRETRYGDAKFDEPNVPGKVATAQQRWQSFDRWMRDAQRTFSGIVTSVSGNRIRVRSPSSGRQSSFAVAASTDTSVALSTLKDKRVQVDYRYTATGPQALRIRLDEPPSRATERGRVDRPPRRTDALESTVPQRAEPVPRPRDDAAPEGTELETWACALDLHQGDTGTLAFERRGAQLRGSVLVRDGSQQHEISGSWKGDRIEFWRALSGSSGQRFLGVAIETDDGVRMAGRFANRYSGVWSADCEPGTAAGAGAVPSGRLDVVLIDVGDKKIAVIKAVRGITGLGLREAKGAVEGTPYTIRSGVSADAAERIAAELERAGARVSIQPTR